MALLCQFHKLVLIRTKFTNSINRIIKAGVQYGLFGWQKSDIADIQSLPVHFRFVPIRDIQHLDVEPLAMGRYQQSL